MKEILKFIEHFKGAEETFLHGCCYWFAFILKRHFQTKYLTDIMYEPKEGHFIARIDDRYFDIRGDVTELYSGMMLYDMCEMYSQDFKYYCKLMRECRDFTEPVD